MSEKAKIRVAVRVRPLLENETQNGYLNSRLECTNNDIQVKEERTRKSFKYTNLSNYLDLITFLTKIALNKTSIRSVKSTF